MTETLKVAWIVISGDEGSKTVARCPNQNCCVHPGMMPGSGGRTDYLTNFKRDGCDSCGWGR
jgi:hypothetical protein